MTPRSLPRDTAHPVRAHVLFWSAFGAVIIVWIASHGAALSDLSAKAIDFDSLLRLELVRDLANGQPWFDNRIDRILPPEGFNSHWSRLVDAAITVVYIPLRWVFAEETAVHLLFVLWPLTLWTTYLLLIGWFLRRTVGSGAAALGMIGASATTLLNIRLFGIGALDHHNLQILCLVGAVTAYAGIPSPARAGVISGAAMAMALAINPDAVFPIAGFGAFILVRWMISTGHTSQIPWSFLGLGLFAPALFVAQTPPADWFDMSCGALGLPLLGLTTTGRALRFNSSRRAWQTGPRTVQLAR